MSRIGNLPIPIPEGVTVEQTGNKLVVTGLKGTLDIQINPEITVKKSDDKLIIKRQDETKHSKSLHGLIRSLIANMIIGVNSGWSKDLVLSGVGFRAASDGQSLSLNIGFSHPVEVEAPAGINFEVSDNTRIKVSGISKYLVGQVAASIRSIKPPDAYKGKGIKYEGEYVRRKPGKAGKVGVGVAK